MALSALLIVTACGSSSATDDAPTYVDVVAALCSARDAAAAADLEAAEASFYGDAHEPLHELAAATAEVDRSAAADLLRAKEAVESALAGSVPAPVTTERLDALVEATRAATVALGHPAPGCDT